MAKAAQDRANGSNVKILPEDVLLVMVNFEKRLKRLERKTLKS